QRLPGDGEVLDGPLGLGAVMRLGGHLDVAHGVLFDTKFAHRILRRRQAGIRLTAIVAAEAMSGNRWANLTARALPSLAPSSTASESPSNPANAASAGHRTFLPPAQHFDAHRGPSADRTAAPVPPHGPRYTC